MNASANNDSHTAVMTDAVMQALVVRPQGVYVDSTYGRGSHTARILSILGPTGKLYALDCDSDAIQVARKRHRQDARFEAIHTRFSKVARELRAHQPDIKVSGIVADLGVSSPQLDQPDRGFSFQKDGPLDMRMNRDEAMSAADWLQTVSEKTLASTIYTLGDERFARRIARTIVERRKRTPLRTTRELAELVAKCVPIREPDKHPSTRTFLAIRMRINRELEELETFLPQCVELLRRGGRLVVITFHSVEDRLVKRFFREAEIGAPGPRQIPFRESQYKPTLKVVGKAIRPSEQEIKLNRRARSAVMRVAERVGECNA